MQTIPQVKEHLVARLTAYEQERLSTETDPVRRETLHLLTQRQILALDQLDLVSLMDTKAPRFPGFRHFIAPVGTALMGFLSLLALLSLPRLLPAESAGQWMSPYTLCVVLSAGTALCGLGCCAAPFLLRPKTGVPVLMMNETKAEMLLTQVEAKIALDVQTLETLYAQENLPQVMAYEDTAAELYGVLYETALDEPEAGKALSWPLSRVKKMLGAMGCEPVDYTEGTAMMFDVIETDMEAQRRPAILEKATGVVKARGLYLKKEG